MLLRIIRFWWLWISRKIKSYRFIKIISTRWCSITWIREILSFTCCLQGWNIFTRWIFNKRTNQERVNTNVSHFVWPQFIPTFCDPKTGMFTVFQIQNVSTGKKYFQCSEQEVSFKRSFFKVYIELIPVDLNWLIGIFRSNLGLCW